MNMILKGRTPVNPTEDPRKVLRCILNIFPNCEHELGEENIGFSTYDLQRFIEILRDQKIRDTAAMVMERGLHGDTTSFFLNKQAAFMQKINFTDGDSILGDMEITIVDGVQELLEAIAPGVE
jgi:predicted RNA binding protein with dsRBD fold (UPF0201 family)